MHTDNPDVGLRVPGGGNANEVSGVCANIVMLHASDAVGRAESGPLEGIRDSIADMRSAFDFDMERTTADGSSVLRQKISASADALIACYPLAEGVAVSPESEAVLDDLVGIGDAQAYGVMNHGDFMSGMVSLATWDGSGPEAGGGFSSLARRSPLAGIPVLVVNDGLFEHVQAHSRLRGYVSHVDPVQTLFRHFDGIYLGAPVVFRYLDYIRISLESVDWVESPDRLAAFNAAASGIDRERTVTAGIAASVHRWFLSHSARVVFAFEQAPVPDRGGYAWLAGYHNAMVEMCGAPPDCRCVLDAR